MTDLFDTVVHGATIVTDREARPGTVAVRDGRIAAVLPADARPAAAETVDAAGLHLFPGLVDPHVHTRHPSTIYDAGAVQTSARVYARSCVTCHTAIHGSNHPSGQRFIR